MKAVILIVSSLFLSLLIHACGNNSSPTSANTAPTNTPTVAATSTNTPTPNTTVESETPTPTDTLTPTNTETNTPTITPTNTITNTPTITSTNTVTNTPTNTPVIAATIGVGTGDTFSPANVTITSGQAVVWNSTLNVNGHTLYVDGFSGSPTPITGCGTALLSISANSFPATLTFSASGTYFYHCTVHGICGGSSCGGCTGMAGSIVVN